MYVSRWWRSPDRAVALAHARRPTPTAVHSTGTRARGRPTTPGRGRAPARRRAAAPTHPSSVRGPTRAAHTLASPTRAAGSAPVRAADTPQRGACSRRRRRRRSCRAHGNSGRDLPRLARNADPPRRSSEYRSRAAAAGSSEANHACCSIWLARRWNSYAVGLAGTSRSSSCCSPAVSGSESEDTIRQDEIVL